jgi:exosortase
MAQRWSHEPQYSHGYLVPLFALYLLWQRRAQRPKTLRCNFWGLPVLVAGAGLRLAAAYYYLPFLDAASLMPCVVGLCLLLGGWETLRWAWPALAFLVFMLPLPYRLENALAFPLQRLATLASTFVLVVLGFPATAEGNIITINESRIGVVEACGGLSMLLTFFALATAFALAVRRPTADRILLVVSAAPVALLANVARICVTGILYEEVGGAAARAFFHDVAGWLMMPLAVGFLWLELVVLARLFPDVEDAGPLALRVS